MTTNEPRNESIRRLQARADYISQTGKRSVLRLFNQYVEEARANPENAHTIPSRNKEQLYKWSKEDDWETHALRHDMEAEIIALQSMEKVVTHGRQRLGLIVDDAINSLVHIVKLGQDKDRLAAAKMIFDLVGLTPLTSTNKSEPEKQKKSDGPQPPGPNASEAELLQYASDIARQGLNA